MAFLPKSWAVSAVAGVVTSAVCAFEGGRSVEHVLVLWGLAHLPQLGVSDLQLQHL